MNFAFGSAGFVGAFLSLVLLGSPSAFAQTDAAKAEYKAAVQDAQAVQQNGPAEIRLRDQAILKLPANRVYIPNPAAARLLKSMGNSVGSDLEGVVFSTDSNWMAVVSFTKSGYVKDDEARDWNADELMKSLREGTEHGNVARKAQGYPELDIVGWAEKPRYDVATHRLVWAISSRDRGATAQVDQGANFNTYALGRDGYFSIDLVTDLKDLPAQKPDAEALLAGLDYLPGKKYSDFNASTDHVAEFGIAALVAGVAAKKLGLLALGAAFFAKFFKLIAVGAFAAWAGISRFLKRKKPEADAARPNVAPADEAFPSTELATIPMFPAPAEPADPGKAPKSDHP